MEYVYLERFEQLLNFQRTCSVLPLFQPILFGVFLAMRVDWPPLPVGIFLLFFSSSVLAKECYQWINEYCEEIRTLSPWFFHVLVITSILKASKIQELGIFYFYFFDEDDLKISASSFLCNAMWLGMLQIAVSQFLVEFSSGKMCACHFKIVFKLMEKSFLLAKRGNLVKNELALY